MKRTPERIKNDWKMQLINGDVFIAHMTRNSSSLLQKLATKRMSDLQALPEPTSEDAFDKCIKHWQGLSAIVSMGVHVEHMGKRAVRSQDVRDIVERIFASSLPMTKGLKESLDDARMQISTLAFEGLAQRRMNRR